MPGIRVFPSASPQVSESGDSGNPSVGAHDPASGRPEASRRRIAMKHGRILQVFGLVLVASGTSWAQVTRRVSLTSSGGQSNGLSDYSAISSDGRFVAFRSYSPILVGGDTNNCTDIFCRGLFTAQTERMSVDSNETQGNGISTGPASVSTDGRYVAVREHRGQSRSGGHEPSGGHLRPRPRRGNDGTRERVLLRSASERGQHRRLDLRRRPLRRLPERRDQSGLRGIPTASATSSCATS
jgi:hypothetical protein